MALSQVPINFIESVRGGKYLYYNGFKFRCKSKRSERKYWACVVAECPARITTLGEMVHSIEITGHSHDAQPFEFEVDAFKARLMERARTEKTPIPTIYSEEVSKLPQHLDTISDDFLMQIPALKSLTTILYRQRHKTLTRVPASRPKIQLEEKYSHTEGGDQFLHCVSDDILFFTTDMNNEHL